MCKSLIVSIDLIGLYARDSFKFMLQSRSVKYTADSHPSQTSLTLLEYRFLNNGKTVIYENIKR